MTQKIFSSGLSIEKDGLKAIETLAAQIQSDLAGHSCDLLLFFISENYPDFDSALAVSRLQAVTRAKMMLGCNASGVIGGSQEVEIEPAVSVLAMHLPGVEMIPFALDPHQIQSLNSGADLVKALDLYPTERPKFILIGEPTTCEITRLLAGFNEGYPGAPVTGGLASANVAGRENWLALNGEIYDAGAVGIALSGAVEFVTLVSQGCRPIGEAYAITKAEGNLLYQLGGRPVLEVFRDIFNKLSPEDKALAEHSLFVGLAMDEKAVNFKRGDFLIRNIMSADNSLGALGIGEMLTVGQTFQFQLRDARASTEDLEQILKRAAAKPHDSTEGMLLVSCAGRGRGLFGIPDHDAQMIQSICGPRPLAGFFANGEFGLIGGRNYIHGYTSSLTLFR